MALSKRIKAAATLAALWAVPWSISGSLYSIWSNWREGSGFVPLNILGNAVVFAAVGAICSFVFTGAVSRLATAEQPTRPSWRIASASSIGGFLVALLVGLGPQAGIVFAVLSGSCAVLTLRLSHARTANSAAAAT